MDKRVELPADGMAERIVRHFQSEGFKGISEALVLRIACRKGERAEIEAAFSEALAFDLSPPVGEYFEIRPYGHFSDFRSFDAAKLYIQADFSISLRAALPRVYFDLAPIVIDDALATGTKYDAMLKLSANAGGYAFAILLNDPDSSFFEYLGTRHGNDWQKIIGDFETSATSFAADIELR